MFELVKIVMVILTGYIVGKAILGDCNKYLAFVIAALWIRFTFSAFHYITYDPIVAGLSLNALASVSIVGIGILLIPANTLLLKKLIPIYAFVLCIVVSGIYNYRFVDLINVIIKWGYMIVISLALYRSFKLVGIDKSLRALLKPFYLPLGLLLLSILLGEMKATEADGSTSYIGGFNHEAAFSMVVVTCILILGLIDKNYLKYRSLLFYTAIVLLFLVNYRTSMLTVLPILVIFMIASSQERIASQYRLPILGIVMFVGVIAFTAIGSNFTERFSDISVLLANWEELLKAPAYFSEAERDIFSSRVYIWSQYLSEFSNADLSTKIFGFGPESWKGYFDLYAHNTYVSYIFEYGYLGFTTFLIFIFYVFFRLLKIKDFYLKCKLFGSFLGFLIMNLATMPLWNIEGLITMSFIYAFVLYSADFKKDASKSRLLIK